MIRMTPEEIATYRKAKVNAQAEALAAEDAAVYNLAETRKLEKRLVLLEKIIFGQATPIEIRNAKGTFIGWYQSVQDERLQKLQKTVNVLCEQLNITAQKVVGLFPATERIVKHFKTLEIALADARRDHALLVRLVERMGRAIMGSTRLDFTIIGQREYDAAMHEAEGPPPNAGMLESVQ